MNAVVVPQGWSITDFIGAITLVVTIVGLGFTVWNTYQTSQRTEEVLRSGNSATLEIPTNPHHQIRHNPWADAGLRVAQVAVMIDGRPRVQIGGSLQNVGRFAATHVQLSATFGLTHGEIFNAPSDILEPLYPPSQFDLVFLISPTDPAHLHSGLAPLIRSGPLWITVSYRDGNPGTQLFETCFTFAHDADSDTWRSQRVRCS